jgi:hypothetical protein
MNDEIVVKTKKGTVHKMSKDTYIRWLCLVEIIQLTEEKAVDLKIDLDRYDWVRPIEFKKYMNERFKGMEVDFEAELNSNSIRLNANSIHHIPEYH